MNEKAYKEVCETIINQKALNILKKEDLLKELKKTKTLLDKIMNNVCNRHLFIKNSVLNDCTLLINKIIEINKNSNKENVYVECIATNSIILQQLSNLLLYDDITINDFYKVLERINILSEAFKILYQNSIL